MELIDSRRLTGPNLVWNDPGALLEVSFVSAERGVAERWKEEAASLWKELGWGDVPLAVHPRHGGAWLVVAAPIDQLYTAIEASETAWARAASLPEPHTLKALQLMSAEEVNPGMIALQRRADEEGVAFLWDDDEVSVGLGRGSRSWPADELPPPEAVDWSEVSNIPVAVVTGTNGKSTNVRLLRHIVSGWGKTPGNSSTDWIRVGDEILDRGDYSGPGGARAVLRDRRVDVGILEVARGGLLRRGAGVRRADVALITNVAEDHMGQYGIQTVDDLIDAKMIVGRLVEPEGTLVLNADDSGLVRHGLVRDGQARVGSPVCWFGKNPGSEPIRSHIEQGGSACVLEDGWIVVFRGGISEKIAPVTEIPITLQGRAGYNVANCLSASAAAMELGVPPEIIGAGLLSFVSNPETNPGRGNYFSIDGVTILLDFAHNQHGLDAILEATAALGSKRRLLTVGTAGDRTEEEIRRLGRSSAAAAVDRILVTECVGYERELGPGGVPRILYDELMRCGISPEKVAVLDSELEGVKAAFDWAEPGDLLILLVKAERDEALSFILERKSKSDAA